MSRDPGASVGVFRIDAGLVVQTWDAWMEEATGLTESAACGQRIDALFPTLAERGMLERLTRAATGAGVEILAPAFHEYLIPLPPRQPASSFARMRQHVTIVPIAAGPEGAVVTIRDVTARLERERDLKARLQHEDEHIRLLATRELAGEAASPTLLAIPLGDASWRVRNAAAEGMARVTGPEAVATLIGAVRDRHKDSGLLNAALAALSMTTDEVVGPVVDLLGNADVDVRTYAAQALGMIGDRRAVPPLIAAIQDPDANVRYHAVEALGRIGHPSAADALASVAESREFFVAFPALDALASLGDPGIVPRLIPLLDDDVLADPAMECIATLGGAATIAGRLSDDALRRLVWALPAASDDRARLTASIVAHRNPPSADTLLAGLLARRGVADTAMTLLAPRGHAAAAAVAQVAADGDEQARRLCASLLGRIGSREGLPALLRLLGDDDPSVIAAAATALAAIGDSGAFDRLLDLLDHPDAAVRHAAVSALNSIGHPDTSAAVTARLADASPRVRESAARIAGYLGHADFFDALLALCDDDAPAVRRAAVEHIATIDDPRAAATIRRVLRDDNDPTVRSAAARGLGRTDDTETADALIDATGDDNLWVRYYAIRSLGQLEDPRHRERRIACLSAHTATGAPPVRIAAIEALAGLDAVGSVNLLLGMRDDAEEEVAAAVGAALARLDPSQPTRVD